MLSAVGHLTYLEKPQAFPISCLCVLIEVLARSFSRAAFDWCTADVASDAGAGCRQA